MYLFPEMISLGLRKNEKFKSADHRKVCENLGIARPGIDSRDQLIIAIVTAVNKVPIKEIKTITLEQLQKKYSLIYYL